MKSKLLFLVTEDWYFCSHRLALAKAALAAGFEVVLATHVTEHGDLIRSTGIRLIPMKMRRGIRSPLEELRSILDLIRIYKRERPDIVHHVALKPVLYGSFAARIARITHMVQAIAGFGFVYSSSTLKAKLLRLPVRTLLRWALVGRSSHVIVQNPDDAKMAGALGINKDRLHLIAGSGVSTDFFAPSPEPELGTPVVTLVARMLWDKGVGEFVAAVQLLKQRGVLLCACLVGDPDPKNPASIEVGQLKQWQAEGIVEWQGHRSDINNIWAESHIAVLPSYREGLPKSLLEAAACGKPMVATDVPGCRSVVINNETGFLVPKKDVEQLADAIDTLIKNKDIRQKMGIQARNLVEKEFSEKVIITKVKDLYFQLLGRPS